MTIRPSTCLACLATTLLAACAGTRPIAVAPAMAAATPFVEVPEVHHPDGETAQWWFRHGAS